MHSFQSFIRRLSLCVFVTIAITNWRVSAVDATNKTAQATNSFNAAQREQLYRMATRRDLIKTRYIRPIGVVLKGDAEKIGLDSKQLSDFLTLKFKNLFTGFELKELPDGSWKVKDTKILDEIGDIEFRGIDPAQWAFMTVTIWAVGEDYPVAYHLNIEIRRLGGGENGYEAAGLGFSSAKKLKETRLLKDALADMFETAAIELMKLQGKM